MKPASSILPILLLSAVVFASGCLSQSGGNSMMEKGKEGSMMEKNESAMMEKEAESGAVMEAKAEKLASNYYRYDPSTYEQLSREKLVFFNFRANWCPICNSERPGILAAFNEMDYGDVVGFEVHYNDPETKDFDNELIRKYQVAYQHTKIILDKDGNQVIKTLEFFDKERVKSEIEKVRSV